MSTDITEIFSPERVTPVCKEYGLQPGSAMDLTGGLDFDSAADRQTCWDFVIKDEPMLVIGSPTCTLFSRLQLEKFMYRDDKLWMEKFQMPMLQAKSYLDIRTEIYEHKRQQGR